LFTFPNSSAGTPTPAAASIAFSNLVLFLLGPGFFAIGESSILVTRIIHALRTSINAMVTTP
jgi:hypothetical protein